ncbi:MAG: protein kinase [Micropruina sp.]|nr:MAG: protein kinase [Micropruina sp.]
MTALIADRYRLETQIGRGGMGQVWRARDVKLDRDVAVKTVDLTSLPDPTLAARFQQEIVTTARLNHPGIVTVFDGGVDGNTAYLVMELLTGRTLADRIASDGPLPLAQGIDIAVQVVQALAAAHAVGLVHRDIKPANVMITDGRAKLLDFGIAQLASGAGAHLTATATTIGTAAYMAPEQAAGQRVGPATDLYAVGCLLTTMFTGSPFDGEPIAVAGMQLHQTPPRLRDRRAGLPAPLDDLVARLLAKDPADRPGAAETMAVLSTLGGGAAAATVPLAPRPAATAVMGPATHAAVAPGIAGTASPVDPGRAHPHAGSAGSPG